ncbi:MAG: 6,7-dimethyl-8-ribityllumazine synthase [Vampirovibrionales bacterium]|nr:6,7-dimethyl-8-ribityllumazine synthase [Vampirovibrionales bacterium]
MSQDSVIDIAGLNIAIVAAWFNDDVTQGLLAGVVKTLTESGLSESQYKIIRVTGAVELAQAAMPLAKSGKFDAIIALGAIIRGKTSHYDHVCSMTAHGLQRVSLDTGLPVVFGVLTCDNVQQARERISYDRVGHKGEGHKGEEAARTALEMIAVMREVRAICQ